MFLLFLGDIDTLNPILNDASAYMSSVLKFGRKIPFLSKNKTKQQITKQNTTNKQNKNKNKNKTNKTKTKQNKTKQNKIKQNENMFLASFDVFTFVLMITF